MIRDKYRDLPVSRQRKYQLRKRDEGKCVVCAKPRVNATHCKAHAAHAAELAQQQYHKEA